jgi:hypothetical protein
VSLKLLFLSANPVDAVAPLRAGEEMRDLQQALQASIDAREVVLAQEWAVRIEDFQQILLRHSPDVVHFSGHGDEDGRLLFEGADGLSRPAAIDAVASVLALFRPRLACVVFNACHSSRQAQAAADAIGCAVGYDGEPPDRTAIAFAAAFYRAAAHRRALGEAFQHACAQLELEHRHGAWLPRLFVQPHSDAAARVVLARHDATFDVSIDDDRFTRFYQGGPES